ncbi:MAG: hypothetical protein J5647_10215 [Spirochaetaceae bacterium]|nr:hypothetical protein [Spirochaetaceae bacterium]
MNFRKDNKSKKGIIRKLLNFWHRPEIIMAGKSVESNGERDESDDNEGDKIPRYTVAGASMRRIELAENKSYWERKYTKHDIMALKKEMNVKLSDEFEERLERLDDLRPGEDTSLPTIVISDKNEDEVLVSKLCVYFTNEFMARRFLNAIHNMTDVEIIAILKNYINGGFCKEAPKGLWRVLYNAGRYKSKYSNWHAQLNKP